MGGAHHPSQTAVGDDTAMESLNNATTTARALEAACAVAADHGLPTASAAVIADANNVLVHLRPAPVVARVATTGSLFTNPRERLGRELAVAAWLSERGAPVVAPSAELASGPHQRDGLWMSFWRHVTIDARAGEEEPEEAARALAPLHAMLADCPLELPLLEPVLGELPRVIGALETTQLAPADLELLHEAFEVVVSRLRASSLPVQVVHGDAHAGNLMRAGGGVLWGDFEDACSGPLAWDLACLITPLGAFAGALLEAYGKAGGVHLEMSELDPFLDARALHAAVWWCWLARDDRRRRERAVQWLRWWRERLA